MNSTESTLLGAIARELSEVLRSCVAETRLIEDSVNFWLHADQQKKAFPVIDIQRLDYLYQVQNDLADILDQTAVTLLEGGGMNAGSVSDLIAVTKLDQIKSRLAHAGGDLPEHAQVIEDRSGNAELF